MWSRCELHTPFQQDFQFWGQLHLLAVPEHLWCERCCGTSPPWWQLWLRAGLTLPATVGPWTDPDTWLCLSTMAKLAGLSVYILEVLAGFWWLGHCWDWKCFVLEFSWASTQCVCVDTLPWMERGSALGCGTETLLGEHRMILRELAQKRASRLRELLSRIFGFALDHRARWDRLCEKASL